MVTGAPSVNVRLGFHAISANIGSVAGHRPDRWLARDTAKWTPDSPGMSFSRNPT
jgi:hypothetical protein